MGVLMDKDSLVYNLYYKKLVNKRQYFLWDLEISRQTSRKAVSKLGGVLATVILTNAPPL